MREQHFREQEALLQQQKDLVATNQKQVLELKQSFDAKLSQVASKH